MKHGTLSKDHGDTPEMLLSPQLRFQALLKVKAPSRVYS
jgi:hypothetical protein